MDQEVRDFLHAPEITGHRIARLEAKLEAKRSSLLPGAIRYDVPRVQNTAKDAMSETFAEIDDLQKQLDKLRFEQLQQKGRIEKAIGALDSEMEAIVMDMYYVSGVRVTEIAEKLHMSVSSIYKFKEKGEDNLKIVS